MLTSALLALGRHSCPVAESKDPYSQAALPHRPRPPCITAPCDRAHGNLPALRRL